MADPTAVVLRRDAVLQLHQGVGTLLLYRVGDVVFETFGRVGSLFFGVGEDAETLETHLFDKLEQFGEIFLALARISGKQGGA